LLEDLGAVLAVAVYADVKGDRDGVPGVKTDVDR
jgi:hypothetical protein